MAAHTELRVLTRSMKEDVQIRKLQGELDVLREPYRTEMNYQKQVIESAELLARSRGLIKGER